MAPTPLDVPKLWRTLREHARRLRELELAVKRQSPSTLRIKMTDLIDTALTGVRDHQVPRWNAAIARWVPGGGAVIESTFTETGTGDLIIEEALVDADDWDDTQAWRVSVSISVGGTFDAEEAPDITITIPAGATATNVVHDGATSTMTFTDGMTFDVPASTLGITLPQPKGTLRLIPEGGVTIDHPEFAFNYFGVNGDDQLTATVSWIYARGVPFVQAAALIDDAVYPGSHTLNLIARADPKP